MYNRVTSDSDAVFASCTALPIHQTTLNVEEMAGVDGLGKVADALDAAGDYISDVVDSVGDYVSSVVATASLAIFGGESKSQHKPNPSGIPAKDKKTETTVRRTHICNLPPVYSSYGLCDCVR